MLSVQGSALLVAPAFVFLAKPYSVEHCSGADEIDERSFVVLVVDELSALYELTKVLPGNAERAGGLSDRKQHLGSFVVPGEHSVEVEAVHATIDANGGHSLLDEIAH